VRLALYRSAAGRSFLLGRVSAKGASAARTMIRIAISQAAFDAIAATLRVVPRSRARG
jgi:hypothetical protein